MKCLNNVVVQKYLPYPKIIHISEYLGKLVKLHAFMLLEVCGSSFVCCFLPALCTTWYQITAAEIGKLHGYAKNRGEICSSFQEQFLH